MIRVSGIMLLLPAVAGLQVGPSVVRRPRCSESRCIASVEAPRSDQITAEAPLHVLIAGAGVGGLALANQLELSNKHVKYTVLERTSEFRKFGGPIQLASNAMQAIKHMDADLYSEIEERATWTGNRTNGIRTASATSGMPSSTWSRPR